MFSRFSERSLVQEGAFANRNWLGITERCIWMHLIKILWCGAFGDMNSKIFGPTNSYLLCRRRNGTSCHKLLWDSEQQGLFDSWTLSGHPEWTQSVKKRRFQKIETIVFIKKHSVLLLNKIFSRPEMDHFWWIVGNTFWLPKPVLFTSRMFVPDD